MASGEGLKDTRPIVCREEAQSSRWEFLRFHVLVPWYDACNFLIKKTFILKDRMAQICTTILISNTLFHFQPICSYLYFRKMFSFLFLAGIRE